MRLAQKYMVLAAALTVFPVTMAWADVLPDPETTWECSHADGSVVYTNKEHTGCRAMTLKPLSVVPNLENMPTIPRSTTAGALQYAVPHQESGPGAVNRSVPDWARDWYANNTASGSVQTEVCSLYMEWMQLVQKTRGGLFFGSDPSYGGDLTGRNQRGASHSFYDNARYIALSRLFGTGFVPVGCF